MRGLHSCIYGECVCARTRAPVAIAHLSEQGCDLLETEPGRDIDGELELWIGAVGPIRAIARPSGRGAYVARFSEPIDQRIVRHFNQS